MAITCIVAVVVGALGFSLIFLGRQCDKIMGEDHAEVRYDTTQELMDEIEEGSDDYNRP